MAADWPAAAQAVEVETERAERVQRAGGECEPPAADVERRAALDRYGRARTGQVQRPDAVAIARDAVPRGFDRAPEKMVITTPVLFFE